MKTDKINHACDQHEKQTSDRRLITNTAKDILRENEKQRERKIIFNTKDEEEAPIWSNNLKNIC